MVATAQKTATLFWSSISSHKGTCVVMATEAGVCWAGTPGTPAAEGFAWLRRKLAYTEVIEGEEVAPLRQAMDELRRYFTGEPLQFACPLDLHGTPFQIAVWQEMFRIPYGETLTYAELADTIGRHGAARAVGSACATNPVAVIVPCHRVVGSNGSLIGYGGGLSTKEWLLALEKSKKLQ
ncbi:MAG: methylated-DNA--[protein]-cysteine S-methyltransferase [Ktedonobacteraceae bacterium]